MAATELVFLPLGGVGEIGMNLALYGMGPEGDRKWLMVDCGVSFAAEEHLPGVDLIFPDIGFIEEERRNLVGIVLTHAHEDHFGALPDLWSRLAVPVHATPFTAALLKAKLAEEAGAPDIEIVEHPMRDRFRVGPFDLEYVTMAHSIPEPNALVIHTRDGAVVHTGDWKLDRDPIAGPPVDAARLKAIGASGVRAVVCDSTNAVREGHSPSESDVTVTLRRMIAEAPGRVAVTCFASNVARIRSVAEAAAAAGRHLVVIGRAMHRVITVARETGYLEGVAAALTEDNFGYLPRDKVVLLCTGSQGEPRAALTRIARNDHPAIALSPGDRVIYSARTIPGNEREFGAVINALIRSGVEVLTDRDGLVHVSGHPRRAELEELYDWLRPAAAVPVHGEAMHLHAHAKLARAAGVGEVVEAWNGKIVRLIPGPAEIVDEIDAGRLFKDGAIVESESAPTVTERRRLAFAGIVTVAVAVDGKGEIAGDPEVSLLGLPRRGRDGRALEDVVLDAVDDALDSLPRARRRDSDRVREVLRRAVRGALQAQWGKRPNCDVLVLEV